MKGDYAPDTFTENDVLVALERAGLRYKLGHRYILSQCPTHEDVNPSVQIYKDDWFVQCHAGCGRYHITKAFPELRADSAVRDGNSHASHAPVSKKAKQVSAPKYKAVDLMDFWKSLPPIPESHYLKGIPISVLNDELGWRWDEQHHRYFIPYFSRSKTSIPFGQWRNNGVGPRFNFWKDAKPTLYGTWNLEPGMKIFLVEGASDAAVLQHCSVPWIAAPSAASVELVKAMAKWCSENDIQIIFAGDNDEAGEKIREALDYIIPYRVKQARYPYKDWGEMFEAEGEKSVMNYTHAELFPGTPLPFPEIEPGYKAPKEERPEDWDAMSGVEKVQAVFPGAVELELVGGKEQPEPPTEPPRLL